MKADSIWTTIRATANAEPADVLLVLGDEGCGIADAVALSEADNERCWRYRRHLIGNNWCGRVC